MGDNGSPFARFGFDRGEVGAAFGLAVGRINQEAIRDRQECERLTVNLAVVAGRNVDRLKVWMDEAERRAQTCNMSPGNALRSVYEDVIAARMA